MSKKVTRKLTLKDTDLPKKKAAEIKGGLIRVDTSTMRDVTSNTLKKL